MEDGEKEVAEDKVTVVSSADVGRPSESSRHRHTVNSQIEVLRRRREELQHQHPEVLEAERLRKEIETLEREARREAHEEEHELKKNKRPHEGVKFFTRPKVRAYFRGTRLFRSRGDNEWAATASISLFTDLLFVGVLAETGSLAVSNSESLHIVDFVVQFLPSWRIWCYVRDIVAIYEMNAVSQRFIVLAILCLLIAFTVKFGPFQWH